MTRTNVIEMMKAVSRLEGYLFSSGNTTEYAYSNIEFIMEQLDAELHRIDSEYKLEVEA